MAANKKIYQDALQTISARIDSLLEQMTLAEKIGQMTQVEKNSITSAEVKDYTIGSVLSGGGGNPEPNNPQSWAGMVRSFAEAALKTRLGIPLIYGADAVHGHNNVKGTVIFPHNIGLGATRNPDLVERIAQATARECLATGVHWNFAPAVSVPQDIRWGRTYEGYSENTELVSELASAYVRGLQGVDLDGMWVLPSVKHYVGDGATAWGSSQRHPWLADSNWQAGTEKYRIDQGDTQLDEDILRSRHLAPYVDAIHEGVLNIMVSFSSWNGDKMHGNKYLLTDVLKDELGFEGFLVSDWQAIDQLDEDFYSCVVKSINAGLDMVMIPFDYKRFIATLTQAVNNGDVSQERIDDAVHRILYAKLKLGLFEKPLADESWLELVGSETHRELAREAVRQSLVLLKNDDETLPLNKTQSIIIAGTAADDIGLACGGWSIDWQGGKGAITEGDTLLDGIKTLATVSVEYESQGDFSTKADIGIVVISEDSYAEGMGDRKNLTLEDSQKSLVQKTRQSCDKLVLLIYSGRPLIITEIVESCDAIVAAWLPGTQANAIADVLFGEFSFSGKLSYSWPRNMTQVPLSQLNANDEKPLWEYGYGLS